MYNLKGIEDDDSVVSIKELISEFRLELNNKNAPFPIVIRIWKNSDNRYEPSVSHFFKVSERTTFHNPTLGSSDTPEKALQVAIGYGLPELKNSDSFLEYEKKPNF